MKNKVFGKGLSTHCEDDYDDWTYHAARGEERMNGYFLRNNL
jgi:hypothetical protein